MLLDDNSFQCPDKDKEEIRYRRDTLEVLHEKFMCEENIDCSYRNFCRYVPEQIKKSKPQDWGTSLCKICLNPELKVEGLKSSNVGCSTDVSVESLISLNNEERKGFTKKMSKKKLVTYKEWQTEKGSTTKVSKTTKDATIQSKTYRSVKVVVTEDCKTFIQKLFKEIDEINAHNIRKISQFRRIKEIRRIVDDQQNKAMAVRMDWSENATLFQCRMEKGAYYHDIHISVNTAVVYTGGDTVTSVGSLSDNKEHGKAGVSASFNSMIEALGVDMGTLNKLYIITDSPSSQYRNAGCAYLTKQFAEKEGVDVMWVFTESGHGKGPMDGVGAAIKNAIDQAAIAAESMPDVVRTSADVIPILNLHNVIISTYNEDHVVAVKNTIPNQLSINWRKFGISKVHEMYLSCARSNIILWKMTSEDKEYSQAIFLTKLRKRSLVKKSQEEERANETEEEDSETEEGDNEAEKGDSETEEGERETEDGKSETEDKANSVPDVQLTPLDYEDVRINSWVVVMYEEEKFLGRVLSKGAGQFSVRCLEKPYGIGTAQEFEKDSVYYSEVFEAPIKPWETELDDDGNRTRKTYYKY